MLRAGASMVNDDGMTINTKLMMAELMPCFSGENESDEASPPPAAAAADAPFTVFDENPTETISAADKPPAPAAAPFEIFDDSAAPAPPPPGSAPVMAGVTLYDASAPLGPIPGMEDDDGPTCRGLLRSLGGAGLDEPPSQPSSSATFSIFCD